MKKLIAPMIGLLCSSGALACQPPPANYFELGQFNAVVNSQQVRAQMGNHRISGITMVDHSNFTVNSKDCTLGVTVEAIRTNPNGPCGGGYTFKVVAVGPLVCGL